MATSTPSWWKVAANKIRTPRPRTAGAPYSPWTQVQDLSTWTSWPVTCSHSSILGTVPCKEAAPEGHRLLVIRIA